MRVSGWAASECTRKGEGDSTRGGRGGRGWSGAAASHREHAVVDPATLLQDGGQADGRRPEPHAGEHGAVGAEDEIFLRGGAVPEPQPTRHLASGGRGAWMANGRGSVDFGGGWLEHPRPWLGAQCLPASASGSVEPAPGHLPP